MSQPLQHSDAGSCTAHTLAQLDVALKVNAQLMQRLGLTTLVLDTFHTENGPWSTIKKSGNQYFVEVKQNEAGS